MKVTSFFRTLVFVLGIAVLGLNGCDKDSSSDQASDSPFVFTINEVTSASVKFDVDVKDDDMRYTIMSVEKDYADQFQDDEALFQDDMEYFIELWDSGYEYLGDVIEDYTTVGDCTGLIIEGLDPETEYVLYAYGLELDGKRTTAIHREYITTKAVEKIDVSFEIDALVEGCIIDVSITPGGNDFYYYFDAIEKESVDIDFGGSIQAAAKYYIDYNVQMGTYYGMTTEEVILEIASQGPDQYIFECRSNTEYVIFAMAVSLDGKVISDVASESVVTGEVIPSDNVITLNVDVTTATSVTVSTTTTNEDPYFLGVEPAYKFEGMSDDEIIETILYEYGEYIEWSTEYGNVYQLELTDLEPGTEYLLMAFGVQAGNATTPLVKQVVETGEGNDPTQCTFEIEISGITENSAEVTITPSFDDVRYFSGCMETGISDEEFKAAIKEEIEMFIEYGEVSSAFEFWQYMAYPGAESWKATELAPGTDYEVFAVPIDMTTADFAKALTRKTFTTLGTAGAASSGKSVQKTALRRHGDKSHDAGFMVRRTGMLQPVQEAAVPMRKVDVQNRTCSSAQTGCPVRHSAFIQK